MTTRLITGATGLVGGAITLDLLERTDDVVLALVRGDDDGACATRLHTALGQMATGYGSAHLLPLIAERVRAVRGDVTLPGCGVDVATLGRIDEIWHSAASLRFQESYRTEIEAINVGGTGHVLDLARTLGVDGLTYVSTAYVAGRTTGLVREVGVESLELSNNVYEESKIRAERLVLARREEHRTRILRPTIVLGHSRTHHGLNWSGMYGFAKNAVTFRRRVQRKVGTLLSHARLQLLADPATPLNFNPVDVVARDAVTIGLSDSPETFFHLGNRRTLPLGDAARVVFELVGLREPVWVEDGDGFTALDEALDKGLDFYRSYMRFSKTFDHTNTLSVCGPEAADAPIDTDDFRAYALHYLKGLSGFVEGGGGQARILHPAVA